MMWNRFKDIVKTSTTGVVRRMSIKRNSPVKPLNDKGHHHGDGDDPAACTADWQLLAEIYTLAVEEDIQRWDKLTDSLIPVTVHCVQDSPKYIYNVVATSYPTGKVLDVQIYRPGTKLLKSGGCFIQWRDTHQYDRVWGLNFVSEADAEYFVKACTPLGRASLQPSTSAHSLSISPPGGYELPPSPEITDIDQLIEQDESCDWTFENTPDNTSRNRFSIDNKTSTPSQGLLSDDSYTTFKSDTTGNSTEFVRLDRSSVHSEYENVAGIATPQVPPRKKRESLNKNFKINGDHGNEDSITGGQATEANDSDDEGLLHQLPAPPPSISNRTNITSGKTDAEITEAGFVISPPSFFKRTNSGASLQNSTHQERQQQLPHDFRHRKTASLPKCQRSLSYYDNNATARTNTLDTSGSDSLLKDYEAHLQQLNQEYIDGNYENADHDASSVTNSAWPQSMMASSGFGMVTFPTPPHLKTESDSGSSVGKHSNDTHRGSSSAADSVDTTDLKSFMLKEEDDATSDISADSMSSCHSNVSFSRQRGAIRKAGWLHVKNMLVAKRKKLERANKRKWKKYWVCLKGTTLLFFVCDEKTSVDETSQPRHMLVVEGSISQALPEHPKRDNIFCLSTAFGDAYLFQASSQNDMDNWMNAIHSACSSAFARQHGKEDTLKLLKSEVHRLEQQIDVDGKMKKMAELQLTVVSDPRSKHAITNQILQWEKNLERLQVQLYRLRCYMASLQGTELPNPKTVLSNVSKPTKNLLGRLGYFSVSSLHALVCARTPSQTMPVTRSKSRKKKSFGKVVESGINTLRSNTRRTRPPLRIPESEQIEISKSTHNLLNSTDTPDSSYDDLEPMVVAEGTAVWESLGEGILTKVNLPNNQSTVVKIRPGMLVQDVLYICCMKRQMDYQNYYILLRKSKADGMKQYVPDNYALMDKQEYDEIEVLSKSIHQVELYKYTDDPRMTFGFKIEAELGDDSEQDDQLCVFISEIQPDGLAYHQDLQVGDELLVINGKVVCDLDMLYIEQLVQQECALTLTVRSCRKVYIQSEIAKETDQYIDELTCPPPPTQFRISENLIDDLIVPAPSEFENDDWRSAEGQRSRKAASMHLSRDQEFPELSDEQIDALLQNAEQVTKFCRQLHIRDDPIIELKTTVEVVEKDTVSKQISEAQKIRKVIRELIDTERSYVKDLNCLMLRYLEPLQNEAFLTADELDAVFGNIKDIILFQETFLRSLEEAIDLEPDFYTIESTPKFRRILFSIGGSFLFYVDHFKLYSTFCASHSKAQRIINASKTNKGLEEFLEARNPKHQHASTLGSYLIKPIQRVLKYPLLLRELKFLTDEDSDEHYHLAEALKGMERVAEHINDMMKIHEEFGDIFDNLIQDQCFLKREVPDLAMDDLVMYGSCTWLNYQDDLGKPRKGLETESIVFVFRLAVVLICKEKMKKKSKMSTHSLRSPTTASLEEVVKYKRLIPVAALQVRNSTTNDTAGECLWDVIHLKSSTEGRPEKVFHLSSNTSEDKNAFLKAIRQILRDYNRYRNSTPTTSVKQPIGKPKTYTPYGGKRFKGLSRPTRRLRRNPFQTPPVDRKSAHDSDASSDTQQSGSQGKSDKFTDKDSNSDSQDSFRSRNSSQDFVPSPPTRTHRSKRTEKIGNLNDLSISNNNVSSHPMTSSNNISNSKLTVNTDITITDLEDATSLTESDQITTDYNDMTFVGEENIFRREPASDKSLDTNAIEQSFVECVLEEEQTEC
ncbi:rho guanine nucleotide exchange factor TIAM1-like [Glandiceps talaboti]